MFSCKIVELLSVASIVMVDAAYAENRPNGSNGRYHLLERARRYGLVRFNGAWRSL